jgi:hypothetical protein
MTTVTEPAPGITPAQYRFLTEGINPNRVQHLRGQSHVEQWDIRRHLIRVFGFGGYDIDTKTLVLVREIEHAPGAIIRKNSKGVEYANDRTLWTVVYRAELRLTIKDSSGRPIAHWEDGASGDSQNQPSLGDAHDQAMKTALSQALKRCAVNLGDQFGLSLYNDGRPDPVVHRSLIAPDGDAVTPELPTDEAVHREPEAVPPSEQDAQEAPEAEAPPVGPPPRPDASSTPGEVRAWIKAAGEAHSLTIAEIAEDFHARTGGQQIRTASTDVLLGYLDHLEQRVTQAQHRRMHALFREAAITDRDQRLAYTCEAIGRQITTSSDLTKAEASQVIDKLDAYIRQQEPPTDRDGAAA